jgi:hypothetical protein
LFASRLEKGVELHRIAWHNPPRKFWLTSFLEMIADGPSAILNIIAIDLFNSRGFCPVESQPEIARFVLTLPKLNQIQPPTLRTGRVE